jgi:antitoxin (DNA-binding transcriptional repressor) of toxin-antitoxin stability system
MTRVTLEDARRRLPQLIDAVLDGEEVVIIRDDVDAVRLCALNSADEWQVAAAPVQAPTIFDEHHDWME